MKIYVGMRKILGNKTDDKYLGSGVIFKRAVKKHGRENFHREILDYCSSREFALEMETYWIKQLNATDKTIGYNVFTGGEYKPSQNLPKKEVGVKVQCIETGEIFTSARAAGIFAKVGGGQILRCCNGKSGIAGKYKWKFVDRESFEYEYKGRDYRAVYCISNDTYYKSLTEVAEILSLSVTGIVRVCKKKKNNIRGLLFRYADDVDFTPNKDKQNIPIRCKTDGRIFNTINDACRFYGIVKNTIKRNLKGEPLIKLKLEFEKLTN